MEMTDSGGQVEAKPIDINGGTGPGGGNPEQTDPGGWDQPSYVRIQRREGKRKDGKAGLTRAEKKDGSRRKEEEKVGDMDILPITKEAAERMHGAKEEKETATIAGGQATLRGVAVSPKEKERGRSLQLQHVWKERSKGCRLPCGERCRCDMVTCSRGAISVGPGRRRGREEGHSERCRTSQRKPGEDAGSGVERTIWA